MQPKYCMLLMMMALFIACKPVAQAASVQAPDTVPPEQISSTQGFRGENERYDDEHEIRSRSPKNITDQYYSCLKDGGYNAVESMTCMSAEDRKQDARLNAAYSELMQTLKPEAKENLIEMQRVWLRFRDAEDQFEASISGNEIIDNAKFSENELFRLCKRANELEDYLLYIQVR